VILRKKYINKKSEKSAQKIASDLPLQVHAAVRKMQKLRLMSGSKIEGLR